MKSIDSVRVSYAYQYYLHIIIIIHYNMDSRIFNLAGMRYLEQELKVHDVTVFKDLSLQVDAVRKRKRKKVL